MFSKYQNSHLTKLVIEAYKLLKIKNYKVHPFLKRGSDERQYNSHIDLKFCQFRTKYGKQFNIILHWIILIVTLKVVMEDLMLLEINRNIIKKNLSK